MTTDRMGSRERGRLAPREVRLHPNDAIGHHVTLRLADDRPLVTSAAARRIASSSVVRVADTFGLLAFGFADTHLHVLVAADRLRAGECARRVEISLQQRLGLRLPFQPARVRPVENQAHLQRAFLYVLRQLEHHGLEVDRAHDGSSLPSLLGIRIDASNMRARVAALLPRVDLSSLTEGLDLAPRAPSRLDFELLPEAAAAAFGLADLRAHGRVPSRARHAATHVGEHLRAEDLARLLEASPSFVHRLRKQPPHPRELKAVLLQLSLRTSLAERSRKANEAGSPDR